MIDNNNTPAFERNSGDLLISRMTPDRGYIVADNYENVRMCVKGSGAHASVDHRDECALQAQVAGMTYKEIWRLLDRAGWEMQIQSVAPLLNKAKRIHHHVTPRPLRVGDLNAITDKQLLDLISKRFADAKKWRDLQKIMEN